MTGEVLNFTTIAVSVVLGLSTGVVASIVAWWIFFRRLAPRLMLDERLNHYLAGENEPARPQVRLSVGPRAIMEMRLTVSLRVPDHTREGSAERLALYRRESDYLEAGKALRYRIRADLMDRDTFSRYQSTWDRGSPITSPDRSPWNLDVLFEEHPGAKVVVTVIARDAFTGAVGITQQRYGAESLFDGREWDG
jgi:hypothetical protein